MIQAVIIGATAIICLGVIVTLVNREKSSRASGYSNGSSYSCARGARSGNACSTDGELRKRNILSEMDCVICMDLPPEVEIYPCHHKIVCENCIKRLFKLDKVVCPLCRANVKGYVPL